MLRLACLLVCGACAGHAAAQDVFRDDETLAPHRPEAWAMNRVAGATVMTAFGAVPRSSPGQWQVAVDLAYVPSLDETERRVGFAGTKEEDLNKSPLFGRLRLGAGLPGGWFAELGYTPPLTIGGATPHGLVSASLGRRLLEGERFSLSLRAFGQRGEIRGDITCPRALAGIEDPQRNPYGCRAASRDRISLDLYGLELVPAIDAGAWQWHASLGAMRTELAVQVDALTYDVHDLSRLDARTTVPLLALGTSRGFGGRWRLAVEVLHVPLQLRRTPSGGREHAPLTSLRVQLRYQAPVR